MKEIEWSRLAPFIADGNDPPMNLIHAAIFYNGVPPEYGQYVAMRIATYLPDAVSIFRGKERVKKRGRAKESRWDTESKQRLFFAFVHRVRERQHLFKKQGMSKPFERALKLTGEETRKRMSAKAFHSQIRKWRKMGVEMPK
jgi:hypothetical protein